MTESLALPLIPNTKQYWLIRTNGGKYYRDFKTNGFIAINWDHISIEEINNQSLDELILIVKQRYPKSRKAGRAANQLRIFTQLIKKGDTVIITGASSNELTFGEVLDDTPKEVIIPATILEENPGICPYIKRKSVKWVATYKKWEVGNDLFRLVQRAEHTITEANSYGDQIEGLLHDFFIRGDVSQLSLRVQKEGHIPMPDFFYLGGTILKIAEDFNRFSPDIKIDLEGIDLKVNVNSPGKISMKSTMRNMLILGTILVALTGGHIKVSIPEKLGGGEFEMQTQSVFEVVSNFLEHYQDRKQEDEVLNQYMKSLHVETPEELATVLGAIQRDNGAQTEEKAEGEAEDQSEVKKVSNQNVTNPQQDPENGASGTK